MFAYMCPYQNTTAPGGIIFGVKIKSTHSSDTAFIHFQFGQNDAIPRSGLIKRLWDYTMPTTLFLSGNRLADGVRKHI